MKKLISVIAIIFILLNISSFTAFACNEIGNIKDILPSETSEILEQNGFEALNIDELKNINISDIFNYIKNAIKSEIETPFLLIYVIFLIILIISITRGINGDTLNSELDNNLGIVSVLSLCTTVLTPIMSCLSETKAFIENISTFTKSFVPVLTGVMVSAGQSTTGLGYQAVMLSASQLLSSFLSGIILPLLFIFLAISLISKTTSFLSLNSLTNSIKSAINWALGLSVGLFVALITIKGLIGASADSVALRTGKFFVGSFVPAVGSALSEAATTAIKSVGIIKNTTGVFGIIAAFLYILPPLIKILLYKFTCDISAILGDILGASKIVSVIRDISTVLGLLCSIILSFGAVIILSTALTLLIGGNM